MLTSVPWSRCTIIIVFKQVNLQKLASTSTMQTITRYREGFLRWKTYAPMQCNAVYWRSKCTRENSKFFNVRIVRYYSQRDCCLPVLLHPLERRCVSSLNAQQTSQSRKSHNFIQPGGKSSDILQTVSTITKFIPTVPVNRIVVLENETPSAIVYTS